VELAYIGHIPPNDDMTLTDLLSYLYSLRKLLEQEEKALREQLKKQRRI